MQRQLVPDRIPYPEWNARVKAIYDKYPTLGLPIQKDSKNREVTPRNPTVTQDERVEIFKLWNDKGLPRMMDSSCSACFQRTARWLRLRYVEIINQNL